MNIFYNHYDKHLDTHSTTFNIIEMDSTDLVDLKIDKKVGKLKYYFKVSNLLK